MAQVIVDGAAPGTGNESLGDGRAQAWISASVGYFFFANASNQIQYRKTTDGGVTYGSAVTVASAQAPQVFTIWADWWTPGNTGTIIHCWYVMSTGTFAGEIRYRQLNTNGDSLGSEITVDVATSSTLVPATTFISGARARGGNLYVYFGADALADNTGFFRSTDGGSSWTSRGSPFEAIGDFLVLFPGGAADNQDMIGIFWDISADELSRKIYDDSANTFTTETSISTGMVETTKANGYPHIGGSVRHSDNILVICAWNSFDLVTSDLKCWFVSESAITAKTDVVSNVDDNALAAVCIDQNNDDIYVCWIGGTAGTYTATVDPIGMLSTDDGATWAPIPTLTSSGGLGFWAATSDDYRSISLDLGGKNCRVVPFYFDDDDLDWFSHDLADEDVPIATPLPPGKRQENIRYDRPIIRTYYRPQVEQNHAVLFAAPAEPLPPLHIEADRFPDYIERRREDLQNLALLFAPEPPVLQPLPQFGDRPILMPVGRRDTAVQNLAAINQSSQPIFAQSSDARIQRTTMRREDQQNLSGLQTTAPLIVRPNDVKRPAVFNSARLDTPGKAVPAEVVAEKPQLAGDSDIRIRRRVVPVDSASQNAIYQPVVVAEPPPGARANDAPKVKPSRAALADQVNTLMLSVRALNVYGLDAPRPSRVRALTDAFNLANVLSVRPLIANDWSVPNLRRGAVRPDQFVNLNGLTVRPLVEPSNDQPFRNLTRRDAAILINLIPLLTFTPPVEQITQLFHELASYLPIVRDLASFMLSDHELASVISTLRDLAEFEQAQHDVTTYLNTMREQGQL